jgi:hypothetical protein
MTIYVDSNKTGGADNGNSWTDAYLTLQQALNDAGALTEPIYVHVGASSPHAETTAADVTLSSSQADSVTSPIQIYGVDQNDSDAPVANPSAVTIEAAGGGNSITITCSAVWRGIHLSSDADDFIINTASMLYHFINCTIKAGSATGDDFSMNSNSAQYYFEGCTINVGDQIVTALSTADFVNCAITVVTSPNFSITAAFGGFIRCFGCDFSGNTSGDTIVSPATTSGCGAQFFNCDMPTTWTGSETDFAGYTSFVELNNCDDSSDYPRTEIWSKAGTVKTDTGVYITTGGWSDETANSTGTPLSQIMEPTSVCHLGGTVVGIPIAAYIDSTGQKTFTVECIDDFQTALQDDEVWLEISYHATSGQVQHSLGTSRVLLGDTPANLTAGTGTGNWTGEPASSRSVRLAVTVTVNNIGFYEARVVLGKYEANGADSNPGAAFYVAPFIDVS